MIVLISYYPAHTAQKNIVVSDNWQLIYNTDTDLCQNLASHSRYKSISKINPTFASPSRYSRWTKCLLRHFATYIALCSIDLAWMVIPYHVDSMWTLLACTKPSAILINNYVVPCSNEPPLRPLVCVLYRPCTLNCITLATSKASSTTSTMCNINMHKLFGNISMCNIHIYV